MVRFDVDPPCSTALAGVIVPLKHCRAPAEVLAGISDFELDVGGATFPVVMRRPTLVGTMGVYADSAAILAASSRQTRRGYIKLNATAGANGFLSDLVGRLMAHQRSMVAGRFAVVPSPVAHLVGLDLKQCATGSADAIHRRPSVDLAELLYRGRGARHARFGSGMAAATGGGPLLF